MKSILLAIIMAQSATTGLVVEEDVVILTKKASTQMLMLDGVVGISATDQDEPGLMLFKLIVNEQQPMTRFYEACRILGRLNVVSDKIHIMQVINDKEKIATGDNEKFSLGRFHCASWVAWEW